jgi:hypothetical protein
LVAVLGRCRDPRHVVHRVAHQGQHVAHQFGRHAKLFHHFGNADALVLHRVEHVDMAAARALADQLHQILVRRNDRHVPALRRRRGA